MSSTEILSFQHYKFAKKIFKRLNINIEFLTGKTELLIERIIEGIKNGVVIYNWYSALFQKIEFKI